MTKILIVGTNSFIGTNFQLLSKYKEVEAISLLENRPEDICFENYDVVLYLAAIVHQSNKISENEYFKINRDLCLQVGEQSKRKGIKQFVFLSTVKVYGEYNPDSGKLNESSKCLPNDAYGKSKLEAEVGLQKMEDPNFIISIIRTPLVYGDGVKANMLKIMKLVEKYSILPFGKMNNRRSITFVGNLVGFIDRIIEKRASGIFITMDEKPVSTTELINCIAKSFDKKIRMFKLPSLFIRMGSFFLPGLINRLFGSLEFDNTKTKIDLNFNPPYSTEDGIKKMVLSYQNRKKQDYL